MATTNSIKWYDNGRFGEIGYGSPYLAYNKYYSNNVSLRNFVNKGGELLFAIMHQPDVLTATPPTLFFLKSLGKSIDRMRSTLASNTTPTGTVENRTVGIAPNPEPFMVYPVPYWRVRNRWVKQWATYCMYALSEAMKHQDNVYSLAIHPDLTGIINMYLNLIYKQIAIEFLKVPQADTEKPDFVITDAMYASYVPDSVFLLSERVDTGAPLSWNLSTEDLAVISQGVPANLLAPFLKDWPVTYVDPESMDNQLLDQSQPKPATTATVPTTASNTSVPPQP